MNERDEEARETPLERVTDLLAGIESPGTFAARRRLATDALRLDVRGVGPIGMPVSARAARKLQDLARPARHGYREQTRLDLSVRDTWEIARSRIKIDRRHWNAALRPELDRIRRELGLPGRCTLKAELHNLLLYTPGQFFASHQDSEKCDDMVGTLVVMLPSEVKGGSLVVEHHDERKRFLGTSDALALVAFYADCHHEVLPVIKGHRVVLTFNLLISRRDAQLTAPPEGPELDALGDAVQAFFKTSPRRRWRTNEPSPPPDRLVYLLDHEYTQRGLGWQRLKNGDAVRAAWLHEVARRLDCEIVLALAEVHETWQCEDDRGSGYYHGRWRGEFDVVDRSNPDETPDLLELIDSSVELRHFVNERGKAESGSTGVSGDEICFTKPSVELDPFKSEHEGFMGNWGNTVDRWYHRAAVVLWPQSRSFAVRARASTGWAIREINGALKARRIEDARRMVKDMAPFWNRKARSEANARLAGTSLRAAVGIGDPELAAALVEPFRVHHFTEAFAPVLVQLARTYGEEWFRTAIENWSAGTSYPEEEACLKWLTTLPSLVAGLLDADASLGRGVAAWVLAQQIARLNERCRATAASTPRKVLNSLGDLEAPILGLIESGILIEDGTTHSALMDLLESDLISPLALAHFLCAARKAHRGAALSALRLGGLVDCSIQELERRLSQPGRDASDWSIDPPSRCACELCEELACFLLDRARVRFEWPIKKESRRHIHDVVSADRLPVEHTTRRSGRPYTLVLVKTRALFEQEAAQRSAWKESLTWLRLHEKAFA